MSPFRAFARTCRLIVFCRTSTVDLRPAPTPKPIRQWGNGSTLTQRWAITLAATAASTYALDAAATVVGVLLVGSELLHGLDHILVVLFLASTYLVWGAGLRVNLKANWQLLETTGTSTSALSKAAYDLNKYASASGRVRRLAASAGYILMEIVKEAFFYGAAFGVAIVSDTVTANDAMIFLAGANLGAAGYEYGLAWVTRSFLKRRGHAAVGHASEGP
ncbi:hypothetical protein FHS85_004146 [Rhodoligotrophos appendicifer]|uniref:hypothetical protein n=1 Tax=Rhodoligotrophos appendicifer TaxID=987056 RepID=UPI001184FC18|nr:hypothetical protein [Rhodoligotrophos appendicifer]